MASKRPRRVSTWWGRQWRGLKRNLNFFRVHVLFFTFTPLIFSGILFAANSPTPNAAPIPYIDALFNCVSAMTVCGLATVDLSRMTGFQQALLFTQCCMGSPVAVAWVIVLIRRNSFAKRFAHVRVKTDVLNSRRRSKINFDDPSEVADVLEIGNEAESGSVQTATGLSRSPTVATSTSSNSGGWANGLVKVFSRKSSRSRTDSTAGTTSVSGDGTTGRNGPGELTPVEESDDSDRRSSTSHSHSRGSSSGKSKKRKKGFGKKLMGLGGNSSGDERVGNGERSGSSGGRRLKTTMIRRMNDKLRAVDPNGQPTEQEYGTGEPLTRTTSPEDVRNTHERPVPDAIQPVPVEEEVERAEEIARGTASLINPEHEATPILQNGANTPTQRGTGNAGSRFPHTATLQPSPTWMPVTHVAQPPRTGPTRQSGVPLGHTMTVEFVEPDLGRGRGNGVANIGEGIATGADNGRGQSRDHGRRRGRSTSEARSGNRRYSAVPTPPNGVAEVVWDDRRSTMMTLPHPTHLRPRRTPTMQSAAANSHTTHQTPPANTSALPRTGSMHARTYSVHAYPTHSAFRPDEPSALHTGYGGFPGPHVLIGKIFKKFAPGLRRRLGRTLTMPRTQTISSQIHVTTNLVHHAGVPLINTKSAPYLSFSATVGRNSNFRYLTEDELEELGGVEYRALTALLWIVGAYHVLVQLLALTVIWPYIAQSRWRSTFEVPNLHRNVEPGWFSAFQVVSAYTNTGTSLVDQSMIPFQRAYPMIFFMAFLILAGNTAFPIFLRLTIWVITKCVPLGSRTNETLHFLLDHPRRCFIYLFPSHQTWFLLTVLITLNVTDWFFFLVLDIGNPTFDSIPLGVRFAIGFLQGIAVRAAGFGTVALSELAPAVQVLYVMMMYISVYPIAMSVRSTNVYEERSLGVFAEDEYDEENEPDASNGSRVAIWGRYLAWHARKQLAFDMWWLGLALFLVCIIERSKIQDEVNEQYFSIFNIIFELISAYGTVGLSLGLPFGNFSFSGAFTPLSKLIVCAVMIRGRHRGLPVAIDRAVMLPFEFKLKKSDKGGLVVSDAFQDQDNYNDPSGIENGNTQKEGSGTANGYDMNGYAAPTHSGNGYEEDGYSDSEGETGSNGADEATVAKHIDGKINSMVNENLTDARDASENANEKERTNSS